MRSRLEADYAAWLDRRGLTWEYEPVCFAGPDGQWLPDFRISTKTLDTLIEVKPLSTLDGYMSNRLDGILAKMRTAWLSEPDARLKLVLWEYGAQEETYISAGWPFHRIWVYCSQRIVSIWPGMRQVEMLRYLADDVGAAAAIIDLIRLHDVSFAHGHRVPDPDRETTMVERHVLGLALYSSRCANMLMASGLTRHHFRTPGAGHIFDAMRATYRTEGRIDAVEVAKCLTTTGLLENAGGVEALRGLLDRGPLSDADGDYLDALEMLTEWIPEEA